MRVAERLRRVGASTQGVEWWGDTLHATVSIGAAVGARQRHGQRAGRPGRTGSIAKAAARAEIARW